MGSELMYYIPVRGVIGLVVMVAKAKGARPIHTVIAQLQDIYTVLTTNYDRLFEEACDACGSCARGCPVSAIPKDDPKQTDSQKCILCMRCIRQCPSKARILPPPYREAVATRLQAFRSRREPEIYV